MKDNTRVAVIVAAGRGRRMGGDIPKQFLKLAGREILSYSLKAFQDSPEIDGIILVAEPGEGSRFARDIAERYGITKLRCIADGGATRLESVYNGLLSAPDNGYVFIHDGARPLVSEDIIKRAYEAAERYGACAVAVPCKDTVKLADEEGFVGENLRRENVWIMQTPQVFKTSMIKEAYRMVAGEAESYRAFFGLNEDSAKIYTDDATVVGKMLHAPVRLVMGSYDNIKITTPEDMAVAEAILKSREP